MVNGKPHTTYWAILRAMSKQAMTRYVRSLMGEPLAAGAGLFPQTATY